MTRSAKFSTSNEVTEQQCQVFISHHQEVHALQSMLSNKEPKPLWYEQAERLFKLLVKIGVQANRNLNKVQVARIVQITKKIKTCLEKEEENTLTLNDLVDLGDFALTPSYKTLTQNLPARISSVRGKLVDKPLSSHKPAQANSSLIIDENPKHYLSKVRAEKPSSIKSLYKTENSNNAPAKAALADFIQALKPQIALKKNINQKRKTRLDHIKEKGGITDIVFSGGGAKGPLHVGAIKKLEELNLLGNLKATYGTSVGSFFAVSLGLGANASEIEQLMNEIDFSSLIDNKEIKKAFKAADLSVSAPDNQIKRRSSGARLVRARTALLKKGSSFGGKTLFEVCRNIVAARVDSLFQGLQPAVIIQSLINLKELEFYSLEYQYLCQTYLNASAKDQSKAFEAIKSFIDNELDEKNKQVLQDTLRILRLYKESHDRVKASDRRISFADLHALKLLFPDKIKDIYLTGMNLAQKKLEYYSYFDTPEMEVARAMRISSSFPFAFEPVENDKGEPCVDGGLGNNFVADKALDVLAKRKHEAREASDEKGIVLGLNFNNEKHYQPESASPAVKRVGRDIAGAAMGYSRPGPRAEREAKIAAGIAQGNLIVVNLPPGNMSSMDLKIEHTKKQELVTTGGIALSAYVHKSTSEMKLDIPQLYNLLLEKKLHCNLDIISYKTTYFQHAFLAQSGLEIKKIEQQKMQEYGCAKAEDLTAIQRDSIRKVKLNYFNKVKNSSIYDVLKGAPTTSMIKSAAGRFFNDATPKQQFDKQLNQLEQRRSAITIQPHRGLRSGRI